MICKYYITSGHFGYCKLHQQDLTPDTCIKCPETKKEERRVLPDEYFKMNKETKDGV